MTFDKKINNIHASVSASINGITNGIQEKQICICCQLIFENPSYIYLYIYIELCGDNDFEVSIDSIEEYRMLIRVI